MFTPSGVACTAALCEALSVSMSASQESVPFSRPSVSEVPQDAILTFDLHLKFLTESYLNFFLERKKIGENYVEALLRLHRKVKTTDTILDDPLRGDLNTTRVAWVEVRDNVAREAETCAALLDSITTDVISPLMALKDTQERIRKRIKEDLKDAISTHADYAENTLPKLKRSYLKKCQETEDFKAAAAIPLTSPTFPPEHQYSAPAPKPNPNVSNRPIVTAPQPLRPLDRRPSTSAASARARSPSTSTALQDLAHQGKKQLNQLMTFLDKGGNMKDLASRSDNALRSVRAKREAEEADKDYRKGIHWLETLRLRRMKITESGYNSLESFIRESAETVKAALQKYSDNLIATAATQSQICDHGRRAVDKISSQKDSASIGSQIPRLVSAAVPKPVYYYNYNVGECKDLIFGVSLVDYATARNLGEGEIPRIVRICIKEIEKRGLDAEGLYRVSGRHAAIQELQHKIERNEAAFTFNQTVDDVYAVSSLLKLYLRDLPEPVFRFPLQDRVQHSEDMDEQTRNNFVLLRAKLRRLPPIHQAMLKAVVDHLARVAAQSEKNKMDVKNLAIVFCAVIFGEDDVPKGGDLLSVQSWKDTLMEDLITNAQVLFQASVNESPPLPPAPLGEAPAVVTYGSSHTRVANIPHTPSSPQKTSELPTSTPTMPPRPLPSRTGMRSPAPEDFMPQLPPRPVNSIHPSLHAGPMSALPARQSIQPPSRAALLFDDHAIPSTVPIMGPPLRPEARGTLKSTPKNTSKLPSRPLSLVDQASTSTGTSVVAEVQELTERQTSEVVEVHEREEDENIPTSAQSSITTFESAMSSGASPTSVPDSASTTPATSTLPLSDAASAKSVDHPSPSTSKVKDPRRSISK
ncbi:hypothetical protein AcW1_000286 [Taiwanofungus camphoratus]|nr:hypothetical protein AcW1_000286 [Antrodia cinnamomea]KAI0963114.1 hypothetical protein AcW1_000286 [Antrodia cinnamomea]